MKVKTEFFTLSTLKNDTNFHIIFFENQHLKLCQSIIIENSQKI